MSEEEILRIANEIAIPYGLKAEIFPDIFSVGVQGDGRTYTPVIVLVGLFPGHDVWDYISREISSRTSVNRVTVEIARRGQ